MSPRRQATRLAGPAAVAWCPLSLARRFAPLSLATLVGFGAACHRPGGDASDAGPAPVAPKELGVAKAPPKPKAMPPVPPLPDLPILEQQQARSIELPFGVKLTSASPSGSSASGCRTVWNGNEVVALPCAAGGLLFGREDKGAEPLVSSRVLRADPAALPKIVDHRFTGTEGPVRNQKSSPACTAFSLATAMDHAIARWTGTPPGVSVMDIWARYHTPIAKKAIRGNLGLGVGLETTWPFDERTAKGWLACESGQKPPKEGCGLLPDPARTAKLAAAPVATFTQVVYLDEADTGDLEEALAAGQDVIVSLDLPTTFTTKGKAGARYVPHWTEVDPDGGHALVVAGYVKLANATYFLLHNSWGTSWGDGGYAWIHATTLARHMREALVVDAEPTLRDPARPKRERGAYTCEGDLVPDSIRGTCTPKCPDGSPRHDGVCAVAGHCPAGMVNLTGVCVAAAPVVTGSDPRSGIAWSCGPGGCTYVLPQAKAPDCKGAVCRASCPAPVFRIARVGDDLTCVE